MTLPSPNAVTKSSNLKLFLLILAFLIIAGTLWYTHTLVQSLQAKEEKIADLYAKSLEYLASGRTGEGDISFVLDEVIRAIDFPVIQTDAQNEPAQPYHTAIRNIQLDTSQPLEMQRLFLKHLIAEMDAHNKPIKVSYQDTIILSYVHYGESPLITKLRSLPYIEFAVIALFILIGYISFSYIKRSEQSSIWVGMARETAHQLGTPISSMLGWVELLKHQTGTTGPSIAGTLHDMDTDLQRLQKIADRFSKIGSKPDLRDENLTETLQNVIQYFERRIPQTGKRVQLSLETTDMIFAPINRELFEWVAENLIKNALDAIETGEGKVSISIQERSKYVHVDISDTGRGIDSAHRKEIFRPGFSTKRRGWGLGLSLSQRIIESYHNGRLYLKESVPGYKTTFRIRLRK